MKIDLTEVSVVPTDAVVVDHEFDGCAGVNCPFYWGEWSMGTPDSPSEFDCGCTSTLDDRLDNGLFYLFVDGGADAGCPLLALVRVARALGISEQGLEDMLDDLNVVWEQVAEIAGKDRT